MTRRTLVVLVAVLCTVSVVGPAVAAPAGTSATAAAAVDATDGETVDGGDDDAPGARTADLGLQGFNQQSGDGSVTLGLTVTRVHADAAGTPERDHLYDEYIVLRNVRNEPLDLTGWTVWEGDDNVYGFPSGFTLGPGEEVTLRTGIGSDTDDDLYWDQEAPVWNNNGDQLAVRNSLGETTLMAGYDRDDRLETCRSPASFGGSSPPLDPDCDGRYQDVDGDGRVTYNDVVVLFGSFGESLVRDTAVAFDFNDNGIRDFDDVVALFGSR